MLYATNWRDFDDVAATAAQSASSVGKEITVGFDPFECERWTRWYARSYDSLQHICFLDIEPSGRLATHENAEIVPGIRDVTVVVVSVERLHSLTTSDCYNLYRRLIDKTNATTDSDSIAYSIRVKSSRTDSHLKLFDSLVERFDPATTLYVAHNGFNYDFKIILNLLKRNKREYCTGMRFSDSLVMVKNCKKMNRDADAARSPHRVRLHASPVSSFKNVELFKRVQTNWELYHLLADAHTSSGDTTMLVCWTVALDLYNSHEPLVECTGERLLAVYRDRLERLRRPEKATAARILNPFAKKLHARRDAKNAQPKSLKRKLSFIEHS